MTRKTPGDSTLDRFGQGKKCSECGTIIDKTQKQCPECGATQK